MIKGSTKGYKIKKESCLGFLCELAGTRTQDPYIKSVLLYQLSYQFCWFASFEATLINSGLQK